MFSVMNVARPRSQPSLNEGFGQVWGKQWPFSESAQQTLPMKLVHHLELGQDHRQDAIDLARKAPNSRRDGPKVARGRDKDELLRNALNTQSEWFHLSVLSSRSGLTGSWPFLLIHLQNSLQSLWDYWVLEGLVLLGPSVLPHPLLLNG